MDFISVNFLIIAFAAFAAYMAPNWKWYAIGLMSGALSIAAGIVGVVEAAASPPWWASLPVIGWLYEAGQALGYMGLIAGFMMAFGVGAAVAIVIRWMRK